MKNFVSIFFLLFTFLTFSQNDQDNCNCGIIYGKNHSFKLTAPSGWVLDNKSGAQQGIHAVFYEKGKSWAQAETVMYGNTAELKIPKQENLKELMQYDKGVFKKKYPGIKITEEKNIIINGNTTAIVRFFGSKSYGNYEAIAYIDAGKTGIMIVMSSRTESGFKKAYEKFVELVKSYEFLQDKSILKK